MTLKVLNPHRQDRTVKGIDVLIATLSFFAVIFAVNGYFIFEAISTYSGVVANEPYRKGLAYNTRIVADERQAELGWRDSVSITMDGRISVAMTDRDARPIPSLAIAGFIGRPSTVQHDHAFRLTEQERGLYTAEIGALERGNWIIWLEARSSADDAEPAYRARRRLWLKP